MQEEVEKIDTYKDTSATQKVFSLKKRIRAVKGGTSASKTISILTWIIDYCQVKTPINEVVTIASESFPHLNLGAIRDFRNIMLDKGYWNDNLWNATKSFYTFETGHIVEFLSVDTYGKAHGPRRDILFLNECNNLSWEIVDQLIIRTRKIVWMDWNPTEAFWFHEQMLPNREDIDYLTLTYKDNEALDLITIAEIESHKHNKRWWNVYGLGQDGEIEGRIYTGWKIIDEVPHEARLVGYGLDYGYTNDPTAIVAIYYLNGGYIFHEVTYTKGLSNKRISEILLALPAAPVMPDSAEPKSNDELKLYGLTVLPVTKGKGSVSQGIQFVQDQPCSVTKSSLNVIKEYRNYIFKVDKKTGKVLNEPEHEFSHSMDAIRYGMQLKMDFSPKREEYIQPAYESPGLTQNTLTSESSVIKSTIGTPSDRFKGRVGLTRRFGNQEENSFEQGEWQPPGV